MKEMKELYQSADWKAEKHVPVIEAEKKGDGYIVTVTVGKEIAHPNTTEHHIAWAELYFLPEGGKFPYQVGRFDFTAHGASTEGPNTSTILTQPSATCVMKTGKPGTLLASSYCNIHGLWSGSLELK
jgi:superoxide reductase